MSFPLDGGEPINLTEGLDVDPSFPKFTNDSKEVYFSNRDNNDSYQTKIESVNIENGERTIVLEDARHGYWSHNERYLLHVRPTGPQKIAVYDKETGNIWDLAEESSNTWVHSCFSPDDSHIITTLGDKGER